MGKSGKIVSLILTFAMCLSLTGCGGGGDKPATDATAGDKAATAGGSTLTFAQGAEPRGLDPALVDDGESSKVMVNIYEGLLQYEPDSTKVAACLAESWETAEDGLSYTFKLRQGVTFHDGTPFNAEAVKFNIDRQMAPKMTEDMAYGSFVYDPAYVKDVEVVDEYTVKINMLQPYTPFLNNLAMSMAAPIASPAALEKNENNINKAPCGTGPYTFVSWNANESITLKANPTYWGDAPKTQNIVFRFIPENAARVMALNNKEVDMIDGIDATVMETIEKAGNTVFQAEGMNINYMAYNTSRAPFDTAENRRAFSQAINVPELVESLYQGYATPANTILPNFMPGYDANVKQVAYDPEAAAAALKAAGITEIKMITYNNPRPYNTANGKVLAEAVQGYLAKAGITCNIEDFDWTTYKDKIKAGDYDVCFYGWNGDNGDPDNFMNLLAHPDPTMNVARYDNAEFKELIAQGVLTPNGDERNKVYADMEQFVADEAVWLPISHSQLLAAYNPEVQNFAYHMTANVFFKEMFKGEAPAAGAAKPETPATDAAKSEAPAAPAK